MNSQPSTPLHPLLKAAAVSVMVASAVVVASMAGWLPGATAPAPVPVAATAPALPTDTTMPALASLPPPAAGHVASVSAPAPAGRVAEPPKPAPAPVKKPVPRPVAAREPVPEPAPLPVRPAEVCYGCGTVQAVNVVTEAGRASGVGAVSGAILGGVAGHQMGKGRGKDAMTVVGVIGGALAGNATEKALSKTQYYEVSVRMDDGSVQTFTFSAVPSFSTGDAVRVEGGQLVRRY
jgi:outer membrane lipoprotein SlyB